MLAGCSSTLLSSPRHRLRSEAASAQFQACHLPSMNTQRLDLPCSFTRKDSAAPRSQPINRPVSLSIEKPIEGCSLRQNIKLPPSATTEKKKGEFWEKSSKSLKKRYAEDDDETYTSRVKRKKGNGKSDCSFGEFRSGNFWGSQVPFSLSCSRNDEERVCFVPSDVIAPPLLPPLSNIPWFDSVITEITDLGEKRVEHLANEPSGGSSSTSSESRDLVLKLSENPLEHEIGNGSTPPNPREVAVNRNNGENSHTEHDLIELVSLLVSCVEQIGLKNISAVNHCIARLGELASPRGSSSIHRLIAYYTEALALRVAKLWPHIFSLTTPRELDRVDDENSTTWRVLNQVSPIPKFIHFTCNEILLKSFEGKDRVHIIDFDIKQGLQWPSLFQSLALRTNPPSHVRITGIGESKQELIETGERLSGFAGALNLPFEFHPVVDRLEDVRLWMLHVKENENVAINCVFQMHKMLYDTAGGVLRDFLGLIRSTKAEVVVMAEQEAAHNGMSLESRFSNSLKYYSAIFDSIDSSLDLESPVRSKVEEIFAREIRNIIACEGRERFERHETFYKWKELMEQGGFRNLGIRERELLQGQMLLKMYSSEDFRVEKKESSLTLSYTDQPLYTISAWSPVDVAGGSSSSYYRPS
ncbi:hypothetical protein ACJIZ3_004011 [Penstemon smallii]|uniref:Scarecrow-like protein 28 n=1 Tax=Penstemon smallii TaxID=265156 RepID=A0ABD3S0W9_9LAMI